MYGSTSVVVNQIISTLQSGKPVIASLLSPKFYPGGYEEIGQHADSWDSIRRVCTLCGHRGSCIVVEPYSKVHDSIN